MSLELARTVADAVLYEGYLLYPYRATSSKNRVRWQFGVLGPPEASQAGVGEESAMYAECLVRPEAGGRLTVHLRFLQLQARVVEQLDPASPSGFTPVEQLQVGETNLLSWDEAVEGNVELGPFTIDSLIGGHDETVEIAGGEEIEAATLPDGRVAGRVVRRRWPLVANLHLEADVIDAEGVDGVVRLMVHAENIASTQAQDREEATRVSFLGAHLLMQLADGAFVSLLEPPDELAEVAQACRNQRWWPVLVGVEGQTDITLVSPIILYDYPAVAPESAGALFDSTEIDEILTLRVMTMTDEEKASARATDPAAAAIIDRCDSMSPETLQQLHGVLRDPRASVGGDLVSDPSGPLSTDGLLSSDGPFSTDGPYNPDSFGSLDDIPTFATPPGGPPLDVPAAPWWDPGVDGAVSPTTDVVWINGVAVSKGSTVKLHPRRSADAQDLFFAGMAARVTGVFFDVDGETHIAVVLVDDPAADLHEWYGRYMYFGPEEIEPLGDRDSSEGPEAGGYPVQL